MSISKQFIIWTRLGAWKRQMDHGNFKRLNHLKTHPYLDKNYVKKRLLIWKSFTLQSVLNQTYKDFIYFIFVDPRNDDVFDDVIGFKNLDPRIIPIRSTQLWGADSEQNKQNFMDQVNKYVDRSSDEIYTMMLDSDDYYHPNGLKELNNLKPTKPFYVYRNGYIYHLPTNDLKLYVPNNMAPCYVHIYKDHPNFEIELKEGSRSLKEYKLKQKVRTFPDYWFEPFHTYTKFHPHDFGPSGRYIMGIHKRNSSTRFHNVSTTQPLPKGISQKHILDEFKINIKDVYAA